LGLLSVIAPDQIDCLSGEARAKTTGFRSVLRQLDGVTNVSSCRRQAEGVFKEKYVDDEAVLDNPSYCPKRKK
jgi:hypothetical protein